jgi:hypothetical protein
MPLHRNRDCDGIDAIRPKSYASAAPAGAKWDHLIKGIQQKRELTMRDVTIDGVALGRVQGI